MSIQNSKSGENHEDNTEWLDDLINQIEENIKRNGGGS